MLNEGLDVNLGQAKRHGQGYERLSWAVTGTRSPDRKVYLGTFPVYAYASADQKVLA